MMAPFSLSFSRHETSTMARVADSRSVAQKVRRQVTRSRDRFWRVEDFDGGAHAVDAALRRLATDGDLARVRRGVYWRGSRTRFGMTAASSVRAVREILGGREAVGAAESSAANLLGLSTQVSPVPVIAVSRRAPTGLADIRLVNRASRTARREVGLNDLEVTILEALEGWDKYVEVDAATATDRFVSALGRSDVRIDRLVSASRTESPRVRERLRFILGEAGRPMDAARIEGARSRTARDQALSVVGGHSS